MTGWTPFFFSAFVLWTVSEQFAVLLYEANNQAIFSMIWCWALTNTSLHKFTSLHLLSPSPRMTASEASCLHPWNEWLGDIISKVCLCFVITTQGLQGHDSSLLRIEWPLSGLQDWHCPPRILRGEADRFIQAALTSTLTAGSKKSRGEKWKLSRAFLQQRKPELSHNSQAGTSHPDRKAAEKLLRKKKEAHKSIKWSRVS